MMKLDTKSGLAREIDYIENYLGRALTANDLTKIYVDGKICWKLILK